MRVASERPDAEEAPDSGQQWDSTGPQPNEFFQMLARRGQLNILKRPADGGPTAEQAVPQPATPPAADESRSLQLAKNTMADLICRMSLLKRTMSNWQAFHSCQVKKCRADEHRRDRTLCIPFAAWRAVHKVAADRQQRVMRRKPKAGALCRPFYWRDIPDGKCMLLGLDNVLTTEGRLTLQPDATAVQYAACERMGHQAHVHKLQPQAHKPVSPSSRFAPRPRDAQSDACLAAVGCSNIKILRKPKAVETVTDSKARLVSSPADSLCFQQRAEALHAERCRYAIELEKELKADALIRQRLLRTGFAAWHARHAAKVLKARLSSLANKRQTGTLRQVLEAWHAHSKRQLIQKRQFRTAVAHRRAHQLTAVFAAWPATCKASKARRTDLVATWAAKKRTIVLKQVLAAWTGFMKAKLLKGQHVSEAAEIGKGKPMSGVLAAWGTYVQAAQTRRTDLTAAWAANRRTKVLQQVLAAWSDHAKRQAFKRQQICEVVEVNRRRATLHTVVSAWRAHTQELQTTRADLAATWAAKRRTEALKQALTAWDEYTKRQTLKRRQIREIIEAKRERITLSSVFQARHAETEARSAVLESFRIFQLKKRVLHALLTHKRQQRVMADYHRMARTPRNAFRAWRANTQAIMAHRIGQESAASSAPDAATAASLRSSLEKDAEGTDVEKPAPKKPFWKRRGFKLVVVAAATAASIAIGGCRHSRS